MHWKAMVRSSVSRAVKAVDCLAAMVVLGYRSVRLWRKLLGESRGGCVRILFLHEEKSRRRK